jgi:HicB family
MDLTPYVASLREDLLAAAAAGDEQTQRTAALLTGAIEPAVRLAMLHALSDMAAEVTESLGDGRTVEVRLDGRQARIAVSDPPRDERADPIPPSPGGDMAGDVSRITLRLVEHLKNHAEQAASSQGVSLNSWIAQAVQGALHNSQFPGGASRTGAAPGRDRGRPRDQSRRLRGWVQG